MRSMRSGFQTSRIVFIGEATWKNQRWKAWPRGLRPLRCSFAQNDIFEKPSRLSEVNYEVFARKYRPQTFDDLVGQTHVSRTLKNAVAQNRLAHAYLFVGPRGVGKTSTARILAKSLNCINGPTITPCGVCDSCKEIAAGNSLDVFEIDGPSNNRV